MLIVHLTASRFFGGPERQMLELAKALCPDVQSAFVSFSETNLCQAFLERVREEWFVAVALQHDTPLLVAALRELVAVLRDLGADLLCCHGYKADLLGKLAARRLGIPVIAVSRGWTGETFRVRLYEALDRRVLRTMDKVVCVSEGQAEKVRRHGISASKIAVIRNAVRAERFAHPLSRHRELLCKMFPQPCRYFIGAAGRLSAEKGFGYLIAAAADVLRDTPDAGFVLFGDGAQRETLQQEIAAHGLDGRFVLAGFHSDVDDYLPHFDIVVLPSLTEGLPNVALEALAAGVPVVATDVGGTREAVEDGLNGHLVPARDAHALATRISELLADENLRRQFGANGRRRMRERFSFAAQAAEYRHLFAELGLPIGRVADAPTIPIDQLVRRGRTLRHVSA